MPKKASVITPNILLRTARKERGWTQQQVADLIGAPRPLNVTRWERGIFSPSSYYIQRLCQLFEKSPAELGFTLPGEGAFSPLTSSASFWLVPYRRNPFFTGRQDVLASLERALLEQRSVALTRSYVLSGLGGIGKTQIAVEYAYRFQRHYRSVFWMRASSEEVLIADYVALARRASLPGCDGQDQAVVVAATRRWLASQQDWLLILDNADNLQMVIGYLPEGDLGHILLTTRSQATGAIAPGIAIEKMGLEEGRLLLLRRAKLLGSMKSLSELSTETLALALEIVDELDGLPLALDQAGAYIEETGCNLQAYLYLYRQRRLRFLQRPSEAPSEYPYTVASTWSLSFRSIEASNPAAAELLFLCAFLEADGIPEELLVGGASMLGPVLGPAAADPLLLNEALQALRRYSLIRRFPETKMLSLHRLVQAVLRDSMDERDRRLWAERAVEAIDAAFPKVEMTNWPRCQLYLPHIEVCARFVTQLDMPSIAAGRLLTNAGWYLCERGQLSRPEALLRQALAIREQLLAADHPDIATTAEYLGTLYGRHTLHKEAELLLMQSLMIREKVFGQEHLDTATSIENLGRIYCEHGRYKEGEEFLQRSLAIKQRLLGAHTKVVDTMSHLAWLYYLVGRYQEEREIALRGLAMLEELNCSGHLSAATLLNMLGMLYLGQYRFEEAEAVLLQSLKIREQFLGPNHYEISDPVSNLGWVYYHLGRYEEARVMYQRALTVVGQIGSNHCHGAVFLTNLGRVMVAMGDYAQAEYLHSQALQTAVSALGTQHQRVAIIMGNQGFCYFQQGKYEQAESCYLHALAILEESMGTEHPRIAMILNYIAQLYEAQNRYDEAQMLYPRAIAIKEAAYGSTHPETMEIVQNYQKLLRKYRLQRRANRQRRG